MMICTSVLILGTGGYITEVFREAAEMGQILWESRNLRWEEKWRKEDKYLRQYSSDLS